MADSNDFGLGYAMGMDSNSGNSNGNCGFGGNDGWAWIWILLIFCVFGFGRNGWGNGNGGGDNMAAYLPYLAGSVNANGALTRNDLCQDMNFQEVKNGVAGVSDAVSLGFANLNSTICQQQYDTAQMVNGLNTTLLQGFNGANVVALQNQNALQSQIAQCCCDNKAALADLKYTIASEDCATRNLIQSNTRDIVDATNAGTRAILDYLCSEKIADLQSENQGLKLAASQQAQNTYLTNFITAQNQQLRAQVAPTPVPAYAVPAPYPYCVGNGYGVYGGGNGCGCNTGYGC